MTQEQYQQWCDFAIRMAKVCYADHKRPSGQEILDWVVEFLERWGDDYVHVRGWDQSQDWDHVCDDFDSWACDQGPYFYWRLYDEICGDERYADLDDLETRADERAKKAGEQWRDQFMGPVACCVRAGLDMATEIGGGVLGFSLGDVRAMYPKGLPDFVRRHYEHDQRVVLDDLHDREPIWL